MRRTILVLSAVMISAFMSAGAGPAAAQAPAGGEADDLAKQLSNPVASLVSLPFQFNWDEGLGVDGEGRRFLMNFQPVMPFKLSEDWNLVSRVIMPFLAQPVLQEGGRSSFGMGDLVISGFFSPNGGGMIWGIGPVIGLPVTSDPLLGTGMYNLGPTAVVVKQSNRWTYGALVNHLWSLGGDEGREDVNQSMLQPFLAYGKAGWTFSVNAESTANWQAESGEEWTIPLGFSVSKVTMIGPRPISLQFGPRFCLESPTGGPDWGFRTGITLIFPTGG